MPDRRETDSGSHRRCGAIAGAVVSACALLGLAFAVRPVPAVAGPEWQALDAAPVSSRIDDLHFLDPLTGWIANGDGAIYNTTDGGATWTTKDLSAQATTLVDVYFWNDLEGLAVGGFGTYPASCRAVVLRTTDGGATWTQSAWGERVNRFQFFGPDLGYASGVTVYKYTEKVAVGVVPILPAKTGIAALPNPFGPRTTISYTLAARARVALLVADPSGRIVRRLASANYDAGAHQVEWDGRDDEGREMPTGIYLYVLHAGDRHEMGKLVRVR